MPLLCDLAICYRRARYTLWYMCMRCRHVTQASKRAAEGSRNDEAMSGN